MGKSTVLCKSLCKPMATQSPMLGAFLHDVRHRRSGRTARKKAQKTSFVYLQMVNAICGREKRTDMVKLGVRFGVKKRSIDVHHVVYCIANKLALEDIAGIARKSPVPQQPLCYCLAYSQDVLYYVNQLQTPKTTAINAIQIVVANMASSSL